jgi:hypothetical protein
MPEDYARRSGFPQPAYFTEDGASGPQSDHPGFPSMMKEIEAGHVEAVIVKGTAKGRSAGYRKCEYCGDVINFKTYRYMGTTKLSQRMVTDLIDHIDVYHI